jgi:nucleoside-diphosphate-sugar epimerase
MNVTVLGATGGLGRNVVDAALARGHAVRALVRAPSKAKLPAAVTVVQGDATDVEKVKEACAAEVVFFCVNPPFSEWATAFPPLLSAAIAGARANGARLIFPGNVWIYGEVEPGAIVDETRKPTPTSVRGKLRAAMEETLFSSGVDARLLRLPEFYGPSVVTLTARIFRAVLENKRLLWPGPLDRELEFVFMPDAAKALVAIAELGAAVPQRLHLPGSRSTARNFCELVSAAAKKSHRATSVPMWALALAGVFDGAAKGAHDIRHLQTHPVLLDGKLLEKTIGSVPVTPLNEAIAQTLAWHVERPELKLQG